jgi:hypothetical protein
MLRRELEKSGEVVTVVIDGEFLTIGTGGHYIS